MISAFRYWPHGAPIPIGWRIESPMLRHHGQYSVLIKRTWLGTLINRNPKVRS